MSRTAETCLAQRYSDGGWRSSVMPADREQSPVHEPGDDDGTADEAEEVAGGAEEDELEGAHGSGCVGRAGGVRPARREWRRGGRPCTSSGLRVGQGGVKQGAVRMFGKPNRTAMAGLLTTNESTLRASEEAGPSLSRGLPLLGVAALVGPGCVGWDQTIDVTKTKTNVGLRNSGMSLADTMICSSSRCVSVSRMRAWNTASTRPSRIHLGRRSW